MRQPMSRPMLRPILIVEDDPRDLELTVIALLRSGLANGIVVAYDGEMALDYLNREGPYVEREAGNPAAILLDLKLPKLNGLEVLQCVRATESLRELPVIMLTSSNEESDVRKSHVLGVDAYVVKPVELKQFMATIDGIGVFWAAAARIGDVARSVGRQV